MRVKMHNGNSRILLLSPFTNVSSMEKNLNHILCFSCILDWHFRGFHPCRTQLSGTPKATRVTYRLGDVTFRFTTSYNCYVIHHSYATMKNNYVSSCQMFSGKRIYLYNMQEKLLSCVRVSDRKSVPSGTCPFAVNLQASSLLNGQVPSGQTSLSGTQTHDRNY